jgi:hypothetical protein
MQLIRIAVEQRIVSCPLGYLMFGYDLTSLYLA